MSKHQIPYTILTGPKIKWPPDYGITVTLASQRNPLVTGNVTGSTSPNILIISVFIFVFDYPTNRMKIHQ